MGLDHIIDIEQERKDKAQERCFFYYFVSLSSSVVVVVPKATDTNIIINAIKHHRSCDLAGSFG